MRQASDTVPADTVISQNPTAGTEVSQSSTVRIFVSTGPTAVTVPDLRGLTVDEARAQLTDQGLEVGTVEEVDDPETEKGKIIDSNPAPNTSVAPGTKINLRVGTGEVAVPNVVGKSQNDAQRILADANLQVETEFRQTNSAPEGRVVEQDPEDGTVEIGGTVKITVAQKAAPTVTPTTVSPTPTAPRPTRRRPTRRRAPHPDDARAAWAGRTVSRQRPSGPRRPRRGRAGSARPSAPRHPPCRTSRASWRASGARRG